MPLPLLLGEPGPVLRYFMQLREVKPDLVDRTMEDIRRVLLTEEGAILLDLLEKSTSDAPIPLLADPRAFENRAAQGQIARDLRRIVSNETEQLLESLVEDPSRPGRRRGRSI